MRAFPTYNSAIRPIIVNSVRTSTTNVHGRREMKTDSRGHFVGDDPLIYALGIVSIIVMFVLSAVVLYS